MVKQDNVFCLCLVYPIIGLIKGLLLVVPTAIIWILPTIVISIISLPWIAFHSYVTAFITPRLGWKIKVVFLFTLPVPLIIWPPFAIIGSILGGVFYGLFRPMICTYTSEDFVLTSGISEPIRESLSYVKSFTDLVFNGYFTFCQEYRNLNWSGKPFDIDFIGMFVGLFIGICGVSFIGISWTIIGIAKLIPCMIRGYIQLWIWYFKLSECTSFALWFFVFLFGNLLMPEASVLIMLTYILFGFYLGAYSAVEAYNSGVIAAFKAMWEWTLAFNNNTNKWISQGSVDFVVRNS